MSDRASDARFLSEGLGRCSLQESAYRTQAASWAEVSRQYRAVGESELADAAAKASGGLEAAADMCGLLRERVVAELIGSAGSAEA